MRRIGTRIILTVLISAITISLLVGGLSTLRIVGVIQRDSKENLLEMARVYGKTFDEGISSYAATTSTIHDLIGGTLDRSRLYEPGYIEEYSETVLKPVLHKTISKLEKSAGIFVIFDPKLFGKTEGILVGMDNGKVVHSKPKEMLGKDESDPLVKLYYEGLNAGKPMWSDLYENAVGFSVMTYSIPIEHNNNPIGVVGLDIRLDDIVKVIEDIKVYETGYAFMLNKDYDYIVHPTLDRNSNLRTIKDGEGAYIAEELDSKDYGFVDAVYDGQKKVMAFARLADGKVVMLAVPTKEIMRDLYITINVIIAVILGASVLAVIYAIATGRQISKPIVLATDILNTTAELDLSDIERTDEIIALLNRKDEIGDIFRATETLREEMKTVIKAIEETTENIATNTNSLSNATKIHRNPSMMLLKP